LINIHFFGAFIVNNFLKYQQSQCLDIYIEPKVEVNANTLSMDKRDGTSDSKEEHNQLKGDRTDHDVHDDAFYDDDTDEYEAVGSAKEDYDEIGDEVHHQLVADHNICIEVVPMTVEMVDLEQPQKSKNSMENSMNDSFGNMSHSKYGPIQQHGGPKIMSALCYALLVIFSAYICIYAVNQLMTSDIMSNVLNEYFWGYIAIPILSNIDTVKYTVDQYNNQRPSGYTLRIGYLVTSSMWNIGFVFALCGVVIQDMTFRLADRINVVLLAVSMVYVSMIIRYYHFKRIHGVGLLAILGTYLFVNMTLGEMET